MSSTVLLFNHPKRLPQGYPFPDEKSRSFGPNVKYPPPTAVSLCQPDFMVSIITHHQRLKIFSIYTHSEMLPAHGYPHLKKYSHLKVNVGKSWTDQRRLFEEFPGAILGTTNCVMPVKGSMPTEDLTGLEGVAKIVNNDFSPIINKDSFRFTLPSINLNS